MSKNPLISVIVPIYNNQEYLCKCVDSILAQTYKNLEVILVDDGSTDNSSKLCEEYAKKDNRIRVIHKKNGGVSSARNAGIKAAKGEFLSFVDNDDWIAPNFIETLWELADKYNAPIATVGQCVVLPTTTQYNLPLPASKREEVITSSNGNFNEQQALSMTLDTYGYLITNKLFDASLFKQTLFPEGLGYEDIWILSRLFQHISKLAVLNEPLYYWNKQNENSQSRGKFNSYMLDYFPVTDEFLKVAKKLKDIRLVRKIQRLRLNHICGFFKRMMLSNFNDVTVIKPMQRELRRNSWMFLNFPVSLGTGFGICCAINFNLAKRILFMLWREDKY